MRKLPPGPRLPAWCQSALGLVAAFPLLERCRQRYGPIFTVNALGGGTIVIVTAPRGVREVFVGSPDVLHGGAAIAFAHPEVGPHSIFVIDGSRHLDERRLMTAAFRRDRLHSYLEVMCEVVARSVASWPRDRAFGVLPYTRRLTLEVILCTLLGVRRPERIEAMIATFMQLLDLLVVPGLVYPWFQRSVNPTWRAFVQARERSRQLLREELGERRGERSGERSGASLDLTAVLARDAAASPTGDDAVIDQMLSMMVAGHETTASSLAWALREILRHPEVEARVRAEIRAVVGEGQIKREHLAGLRYLEACIKETLRLWPPIPLVVRRLTHPFPVMGYPLPAGVTVAPCSYLAHREPDLWPEPHRFLPDRFLGEAISNDAYFPFGGGARRCIGMGFSLEEMKAVLAAALQIEALTLASRAPVHPHRSWITLTPRPDVALMYAAGIAF